MWRISLPHILQNNDLQCWLKTAGVITNDGFLECIILYNTLCTMHAGETMHPKPCYKMLQHHSGPLFTNQKDALPQNLVETRSREIRVYYFPIALKLDRRISNAAAEMPVKNQNDKIIIMPNLAASGQMIWRREVRQLREWRSMSHCRNTDELLGNGCTNKLLQAKTK